MTRTQQFIEKNKKVLTSGPAFFNPDTSLMSKELFDKAKCKILLICPTPLVTKTVSSTVAALNDFIIEHCPDTFLDVAYFPEAEDIKHYDAWNVPYAIGHITHLDPSHFDIIGFSISVLHEIVAAPVMLKTFERCDKPIPLFWSQRKDLSVGECPVIYAGGITAVCGESMFGKVEVAGKVEEAYLDFMYLGDCGHTNFITNRFIEAISTGKVTRMMEDHDVPGYPHKEIENFEAIVSVTKIQDFVESIFDLEEIYQPQAYEVEYNSHNQIIKNIKINPKARDFVHPYYPLVMAEDLGIGRTVIPANGDNCGVTQTQVTEGCSAGGACNFSVVKGTRLWTSEGLVKIEDYDGNKMRLENNQGLEWVSVQKVDSEKPWLFRTKQGHELVASKHHKFFVVNNGNLVQKLGEELQEGDIILRKLGRDVNPSSFIDCDFAELLGFMHGDGWFDTKRSRWKIYMSDDELPVYEPLFRKYVKTSYKTRIHYKGETGNIWVIEGSAPYIEYDIADVSCENLYVPECIMRGSNEVIQRYLKGIFQADGWYNGILGLTSISRKYLQDIMLLLSTQGIDSTLRVNEYFKRNPLEGRKISYYIQIPKEFHERFETLIGSVSKHVTDFSIGNRTKGWLKSDECFRKDIRERREELRSNGMSDFLSGPRNYIADYKWRRLGVIDSMKEAQKLVASGRYVTDIIDIIEEQEDLEEMYDVITTSNHHCVYNDWLTHNCSEGNYTGGFVEKTPERTLQELWESKKYSAGYKYKAFSFNTNYITNYKGQLGDWIRIYPKVTFLNMRMEELGRDPDALKMMKLVGSNRLSCPLEGMSPRLMNNLLNKCLSEEAIDNVMSYCVHGKMTDIKVGGIFTGYEEDEDKQWICDFVDKYEERAAQEGGNFPFRLKMTPLVHYPLTPIEYLERRSAKKSFLGEHWLEDEWYEKFREHNVHFKVNGFRYSTFLEQTFVDLGRSLTSLIYKNFVSQVAPIYSLRSCATDEYLADLRSIVDVNVYFNDRDIDHYISPCHRIHIDLMGSYIPRARRMLRAKHNGSVFDNEPDTRCLLTRIGAKVKCYHNCAKDEPLMMYYDVTMDEDGNLHGDSYPLTGCMRCPTPEYRKQRLARKVYQTMDSEQLTAVPRIPKIQKIRFVLKRNPDYDVLNPNNTAHTFLTKFLQNSDTLLKAYHSVVCHNLFWQCGPEFKYFTSGFQVVDTLWSKNVIQEVKSLVDVVNKDLVSVQVVSCQDILRDEKLDIQDLNFFTFESTIGKEYFDTASHQYKGQIYQEKAVQGFALEMTEDKALQKPFYMSKGGKTIGAFCLPAKYNPVQYLRGYLSTVKKLSEDAIVTSTDFSCQFVMRENRVPCKNCGKEYSLISLTTGKVMPWGKNCLCKALLTQLSK